MTKTNSICLAIGLAFFAGAAQAATFTVFTDRTAFEAAAGGGLLTETFDSVVADVDFAAGSTTVGDVTISADEDGTFGNNIIDAAPILGAVNGNGTTALNIFTTAVENASLGFAAPIRAWGADFFNFNDGERRTDISILGSIFMPDIQPSSTNSFFGVISDMDFSTVDFLGIENDVFGVDNVSYGQVSAVPLPATLPLLAAGLFGFGLFSRRRKA